MLCDTSNNKDHTRPTKFSLEPSQNLPSVRPSSLQHSWKSITKAGHTPATGNPQTLQYSILPTCNTRRRQPNTLTNQEAAFRNNRRTAFCVCTSHPPL